MKNLALFIRTKYIIFFIYYFLLSNIFAYSQKIESNEKKLMEHKVDFIFSLGYLMGGSSHNFFDFYKKQLSGLAKEFKLSPSLSFGVSYRLTEKSNILIIADLNRATLNDNYIENISTGHTGSRTITQNFRLENFPVTVNYKFHPVLSNYFTYLMIGIGATYSHIKWEESVYSSIQDDIRKGGEHYNSYQIIPAMKFASGIELGFDKKSDKYFLNSFFLDFNFNFFFRNVDIFYKLVNQFYQQSEDFKKKYTILPFYFGLNIGIIFNLDLEK